MLRSWLARAVALATVFAVLPEAAHGQYAYPAPGPAYTVQGQPYHAHAPAYPVSGPMYPDQGAYCGPAGCAPGGACNGYGCPTMVGPVRSGWLGHLSSKFSNLFYARYCCTPNVNCGQYVFCTPRPPILRFPYVCGKPVVDPCTWDHYGYYQTCWAPWGFPPAHCHCPTQQLAAVVPAHTPRADFFSGDIRAQQPNLPVPGTAAPMTLPKKEPEAALPTPGVPAVQGLAVDVLPTPREFTVPVATPAMSPRR